MTARTAAIITLASPAILPSVVWAYRWSRRRVLAGSHRAGWSV